MAGVRPQKASTPHFTPSQAKPRAHAAFFARIRSDLDLIERSPVCSPETAASLRRKVEKEMASPEYDLGSKNLIYPQTLKEIGLDVHQSLQDRKEALSFKVRPFEPSDDEIRLMSMLKEGADSSRTAEWTWRVGEHAEYMCRKGWYPFFITLTVDPKVYDPELIWGKRRDPKRKTPFGNYLSRLARVSMKACGVKREDRDKMSDRDYLHHFFAIEHGKTGEHHHAHGLVWFRDIPHEWKVDPNHGVSGDRAIRRRCPALETYWPYCIPKQRPAKYFRHLGDVWSRMGHKVPIEKGSAIDMRSAMSGGAYVTKYLKKEDKKWNHRVKATRRLGLTKILEVVTQMPQELLEQQTAIHPTYDHLHIQTTKISVPLRLIKRLARLELYSREFQFMDLKTLLCQRPKPFLRMLKSLSEIQPWLLPSKERYDWLLSVLPPAPVEFCEDLWWSSLEYLLDHGFEKETEKSVQAIGAYQL